MAWRDGFIRTAEGLDVQKVKWWQDYHLGVCFPLSIVFNVGSCLSLYYLSNNSKADATLPNGVYNYLVTHPYISPLYIALAWGVCALFLGLVKFLNWKFTDPIGSNVIKGGIESLCVIIFPGLSVILGSYLCVITDKPPNSVLWPLIVIPTAFSYSILFLSVALMARADFGLTDIFIGMALGLALNIPWNYLYCGMALIVVPLGIRKYYFHLVAAYEFVVPPGGAEAALAAVDKASFELARVALVAAGHSQPGREQIEVVAASFAAAAQAAAAQAAAGQAAGGADPEAPEDEPGDDIV